MKKVSMGERTTKRKSSLTSNKMRNAQIADPKVGAKPRERGTKKCVRKERGEKRAVHQNVLAKM